MNPIVTNSQSDTSLELLIDELTDRLQAGESIDFEAYADQHPDHAEQLRKLVPALEMMVHLKRSAILGAAHSSSPDRGPELELGVLGDFCLLREVGRGGMGIVYEAEQISLRRRVALKVLPFAAALDARQIQRFQVEAQAAACLHHPHIVPVHGVGCERGVHYYAMQLIDGQSLAAMIGELRRLDGLDPGDSPIPDPALISTTTLANRLLSGHAIELPDGAGTSLPALPIAPVRNAAKPPTPPTGRARPAGSSTHSGDYVRAAARLALQAAEALDHAHAQGILHRDIKPGNLMLDAAGRLWITDFGLAQIRGDDRLTLSGDVLGTLRYMSPEQALGRRVVIDGRTDIYSLGVTLYELLTLQPAVDGRDRADILRRISEHEPAPPRRLNPAVPRDLETIISKATDKDLVARYATAGDLVMDLRRFLEDRPIRARRVSAAERLARWCRRNPWLAASIGGTVAALLAAVVMSLLYANRQARYAVEQAEANLQIKAALGESNRRLAVLNFERGRAAFEKGHVGEGMLWTVESLRMATAAGAEDWKRVALANLSAWRRHHVELKGLLSHGDQVSSVTFSPDGRSILTGCWDQTRLWDAATFRPIGEPLVQGRVSSVAYSPDGRSILTGTYGSDNTAWLWEVATGRPVGRPLTHQGGVLSVAFSPDGKTALTGGFDRTARLWDAATGLPIEPTMPHPSTVSSVAFSPDGKTILTGCGDKIVRQWDAATGRTIGPPLEHGDWVWAVAFSPDGQTILTGSQDKTARRWDATTGRPVGPPMPHSQEVRSVAFSPDGQTILTGCSDGTAQVWDAATGRRMGWPLVHQGAVLGVAYSPDGRSILTGSDDGTARLWDAGVVQPFHRPLDYGIPVHRVAFGPDGGTILLSSVPVQLREVASGRLLGRPVDQGWGVAVSPDGQMILTAAGDNAARRWDAATGRALGPPMEHPGTESWHQLYCGAFSPDGRSILTGSNDGTVRLWDAATGQRLGQIQAHSKEVLCVAFSPNGRTILTGSQLNTARLWDVATGQPIGPPLLHRNRIDAVAFSPDGKVALTGSIDKTVRLWDAATGLPIGPPLMHSGGVSSVAYSPDGRWILTGGQYDTSQLWDAATGQPIGPPLLDAAALPEVAFSRDGRFLLRGDVRSLQRWDAPAPLPDDVPRLTAWVEAATGLKLDERVSIRTLDQSAWLEHRRRLEELGGAPPADPAPRLDPILFGPDPAARGDAWRERGQWDRAEAAYAEAARARPLNATVWDALARLHAVRGHLDRAAATLAAAVQLMPDDVQLHEHLALALLGAGDRAGLQRSTAAVLARFERTNDLSTANEVASVCVMGAEATAEPAVPVRLAEFAVRGANVYQKPNHLNTLGAALYRAGQYDEAIGRLEEAIRLRGGASLPDDWEFLAMAHHRLGHRDEALRWLDRLREHRLREDPDRFWEELWIRQLRSEAEAVILYDPAFPNDPFAR
jgi:eukaryotic-like serine/threonine-protein kinase